MNTPILVTGATGTIGQALVKQLQARGATFAVMSSKPRREVGGSKTVHGDMADATSLRIAFAGVETLFLLFPYQANAVELARNAVQAAQAAGVKHIVRSSGAGADANSLVAIAQMQGTIDQLIEQSGIPYTLLRPNGFMQNWVNFSAAQIKAGAYAAPNGDGAISVIDVRDIADVAATVLTHPAAHVGKAYTLSGGEALSTAQQLAMISAAAGHPVRYDDISEAQAKAAMLGWGMDAQVVTWTLSLSYVYKQGWGASISPDVQALTGHPPRRFADFVAENAAAWR
ncbi:SDR family oxidoreductase [soil metagenome]